MRATSTPATPEATRDAASTTRTPAAAPIVEEHVALAHGQESKAVFLHRLREDLHRAAEEELAGSVWAGRRLPWLEQLVDSYERRSAADLLREAQGWLGDSRPSDAVTLRARIVERTRAGIQRWRRVGESGAEAPASVTTWMTDVLGGAILARDAEGPGPPRADLQAFGPLEGGEGLSGPIRERAHASLGAEASRVRLHRGIAAERIAERHAARALTVGHHIVLGRSAPPPDTLAGRALLAHELVHVGQQARPGGADPARMEAEADTGALAVLTGGTPDASAGGLRLQRCSEPPRTIPVTVDPSTYPAAPPAAAPARFQAPGPLPADARPLGMRLESADAAERARAVASLASGRGPGVWRQLLLASDSPHVDVRTSVRGSLTAAYQGDPAFRTWLAAETASPSSLIGDLAIAFASSRGAAVDLTNYRSVLRQRIDVARLQIADLDARAYRTVSQSAGQNFPREPFSAPALDAMAAELATADAARLSEIGVRLATLGQRLAVTREAIQQADAMLAALPPDHPLVAGTRSHLLRLLLDGGRLTGGVDDEQRFGAITSGIASFQRDSAYASVHHLLVALRQGREQLAASRAIRPLPSFRNAWPAVQADVVVPLIAALDPAIADLEAMEAASRTAPEAVLQHLHATSGALQSLTERMVYASSAISAYMAYAELTLLDDGHEDLTVPDQLALKGAFADFAMLAQLRDADPERAAREYQAVAQSQRVHDALETIRSFEEIREGEARFAQFVGTIAIILLSIETAGATSGLLRGFLGRATTLGGRAAIGTAVFATEVTTFHLTQRGLRWAAFGEPFYGNDFWSGLGETALMFGLLKGVSSVYRSVVTPRLGEGVLNTIGQHGATFAVFQGWAVGGHYLQTGQLLGLADRRFWELAGQNALTLGALHLGGHVIQPMVAPLRGRVAEYQVSMYNGRAQRLGARLDAWRTSPNPTEAEGAAILRAARALYLERIDVLRAIRSADPASMSETELRAMEAYLRGQASACDAAILVGRYRLGAVEGDAGTMTYQGEPAGVRGALERQGWDILEVDAASGRIRARRPDGTVVDLIRTSRATGARRGQETFEELEALAEAYYETVRAQTPAQVAAEVARVARATGLPPEAVRRIRSHVFVEEHDIPTGPGQIQRSRFSADTDIARLWRAAADGSAEPADLQQLRDLLAHEYVESRLMGMGMPYLSTHASAWSDGSAFFTPEAFGAHNAAPHAHRGGFPHWSALELDPARLPGAEPVRDLEGYTEAIIQEIARTGRAWRLVTSPDGTRRFEPVTPAPARVVPASGPGPTGALPDRTIPIDLWHGTSAEGAAGVRGGVRVDVNSAHPGRRQWGEGFYLGDSAAIGEEYASQTASPTVLRFRPVVLSELGEVLDLTTGVDASTWDAWLDGPIADGLPMTRRTIWDSNPEGRGQLFNAFLAQIGRQPDVVIAPHPPGRQVIVRTQRAADILNANLP